METLLDCRNKSGNDKKVWRQLSARYRLVTAMSAMERPLPLWPDGLNIGRWIEETVYIAQFPDFGDYHEALRQTVLRLAADPASANPTEDGGIGSVKLYDIDKWGCPAATLVNERAMELFRRVTRQNAAAIDLSWASLYRAGDYCMPHSHPRTLASILYALDPGDAEDSSGQFCFADPRMKICCGEQAGYMSTPCAPNLEPGMMMMFPGQTVHFVTIYRGQRPRITLSWNLNQSKAAGEAIPYEVKRMR